MSNPQVQLKTTKGDILIELKPTEAPKTVANFLSYVEAGFFNGTIFHRVIPGFMVQGGGFETSMKQKAIQQPPIENEADNGLLNVRGSIAMARTQDPHSATAQFFINLVDNHFLDHSNKTMQGWGYAVFGQVLNGLEVVDDIATVTTGRRGYHSDVPQESYRDRGSLYCRSIAIRYHSLIVRRAFPALFYLPDVFPGRSVRAILTDFF